MKPTLKEQIKQLLETKEFKPHAIETQIWEYKDSYMKSMWIDDACFKKAHKQLCKVLNDYIEYDCSGFIKHGGIYLIENFYIGQTGNITNRLASHILECFYEEYGCITYVNKEKREAILKVLETRKLRVKLLSDDLSKEKELIQEYYLNEFPLLNKVYINKELKKKLAKKQGIVLKKEPSKKVKVKKQHTPKELDPDLKNSLSKLMKKEDLEGFEHYLKTGEVL